jgi:uncharacterized protein
MPAKTDWLLVALAASGQGMLSPVQIQKTMFIFKQGAKAVLSTDNFYDFIPYNYGPFDAAIYRDLDVLEMGGLTQVFNRYHGGQRRYGITPAGRQKADLVGTGNDHLTDYLAQVTQWVEGKSFADLIRAVYQQWPEFRANSVFVDSSQG